MTMVDEKAAVLERAATRVPLHPRDDVHQHAPFEPLAVARIAVAALGAAAVWFRVYEPIPQVSVIGLLALAFSVWPVLREALANLLARRMTMELSMLIAIAAAAAIAEIFTRWSSPSSSSSPRNSSISRSPAAAAPSAISSPSSRARRASARRRNRDSVRRRGRDRRHRAGQSGRKDPGRRGRHRRSLDGRPVAHHRRIHACRQSGGRRRLCRLDQSYGRAGDRGRTHRARHQLRPDHRGGGGGRAEPGPGRSWPTGWRAISSMPPPSPP